MSLVLIIDPNSEAIKKQFIPMQGIICETADDLEIGKALVESQQFDYILIDYNLNQIPRQKFMEICRASQPSSTFHYIVDQLPESGHIEELKEIDIADGHLRRPIKHANMHDLIGGVDLVDQSDIDKLFGL